MLHDDRFVGDEDEAVVFYEPRSTPISAITSLPKSSVERTQIYQRGLRLSRDRQFRKFKDAAHPPEPE